MLQVKQGDAVAIDFGNIFNITKVKKISPCGHIITCVNGAKFNADGTLHGKSSVRGKKFTSEGRPIALELIDTVKKRHERRKWITDWVLLLRTPYLPDDAVEKILKIAEPYIPKLAQQLAIQKAEQ